MGILQARILEWVAIPFSRGSSWPRNWTRVSCIAGRLFTGWATRKAQRNDYWNSKGESPKQRNTLSVSRCAPWGLAQLARGNLSERDSGKSILTSLLCFQHSTGVPHWPSSTWSQRARKSISVVHKAHCPRVEMSASLMSMLIWINFWMQFPEK